VVGFLLQLCLQSLAFPTAWPVVAIRAARWGIAGWLEVGRDRWKLLGPYWGVVQAILEKYSTKRSADYQTWNDGNPPPDFLSLYNYGEDHLNLCAAMMYLNRTSAATDMDVDAPHSITTPDGEALYIPGAGIVDP